MKKSKKISLLALLAALALAAILVLNSCQPNLSSPQPQQPASPSQSTPQPKTNNLTINLMKLTSPVFKNGDFLPAQFTCDGQSVNPPLEIADVPPEAKTLALVVDDPDAPSGDWVHWLVWNIPASTKVIAENSVPAGIEGTTDSNRPGYGAPCPPGGIHRYFFKLYALDRELNLPVSARKADLEAAMDGYVVASAELISKYARP